MAPEGVRSTGWHGYQPPSLAYDLLDPYPWKLLFVQDNYAFFAEHDGSATGNWLLKSANQSDRGYTGVWLGNDGEYVGGWNLPRITRFISVQLQE